MQSVSFCIAQVELEHALPARAGAPLIPFSGWMSWRTGCQNRASDPRCKYNPSHVLPGHRPKNYDTGTNIEF